MKKTYIKYFKVFLIIGLVITAGCKKNINITATDDIDALKTFQTPADIELGVVGAYAAFNYYNSVYIAAIMSDEVRWGLDNNSRNYGAEHKWQFDSSNPGAANVTAPWINQYLTIDRANRVLAALPNIKAASATDQANMDRGKGELLALRGFCHFELLRNYAQSYDATAPGVPIVLVSTIGQPARATFAAVIAQVKTDLAAAKALIPSTYSTTDPTRLTKLAVSAIQARVALYEKNWADAVTYSTEVINAMPLATRAQFPQIWLDASTAEQIFSVKTTSTSAYIGVLFRDVNRDIFFSPAFKTIDLFDKVNDIRYPSYIKQDLTLTPATTKEQWIIYKYPGSGAPTTGLFFTNNYNNTKVLRVSEMYLIRAEAYAEIASPNYALATADLNALRAARITGYVNANYTTHDDVITQVYTERMKELFAEGHRFYDLKRRNMSVIRDPRDIVTGSSIPQTLLPTNRNYQLPIPQAEILANPNCIENSFYL